MIDNWEIASTHFLGFGAQWDATADVPYGVTDQDYQVIEKRIRWMRLPIVRKMMLTQWVLVADGAFDFDTTAMALLYRQLDICQREGITVVLTDWGCEQPWNRAPGIRDTADPKYARAIGSYLEHLIRRRGYTVIRYLILVNEPNFEVRDFDRWKTGVANVRAELVARGLDQSVGLLGPDHSNAESWLRRSVDEIPSLLAGYDVHHYASDALVRSGGLEAYFRAQWDYVRAGDRNAEGKPLIVAEAGMSEGFDPQGNVNINSRLYGLWMADYGAQAARAGSHAILAWMLDDNGFLDSTWGMWTSRPAGLSLRPWFYPWSLLTRYFPPGSTVYRTPPPSADLRILAAHSAAGGWTFCLVNRSGDAAHVLVKAPDELSQAFQVYEYSPTSSTADADGFPVPIRTLSASLDSGLELSVPGSAVVVATSVNPASSVQ